MNLLQLHRPSMPGESLLWGDISFSTLSGGRWRLGKEYQNVSDVSG